MVRISFPKTFAVRMIAIAIALNAYTLFLFGQGFPVLPQPDRTYESLVQANTVAFVRFDTSQLGLPAALGKLPIEPTGQVTDRLKAMQQWLATFANQGTAFARIDLNYSSTQSSVHLFVRDEGEKTLARWKTLSPEQLGAPIKQSGWIGIPLMSNPREAKGNKNSTPSLPANEKKRLEFAKVLREELPFPVALVAALPDYVQRTIKELVPELPQSLGGGPSSVLVNGMQWIGIGFDPASLRGIVIIQSDSESTAKSLVAALPTWLEKAPSLLPETSPGSLKSMIQRLRQIQWTVRGSRLEYQLQDSNAAQGTEFLKDALELVFGKISQQSAMDHFKTVALGMHQFIDAYKVLPPGKDGFDSQGKARLSWRVHILPFIGQQELHSQFKLDEAWDGPHNKTLLSKIPSLYRIGDALSIAGTAIPEGHTTLQAPVGKDTIYGQSKATSFSMITDGTSNTIWLVEVQPERSVPWTAPQDYEFVPEDPTKGLQATDDSQFIVGFADGSVRRLPSGIPAQTWVNLFQKADGNVITLP
jgi:hypothetical protein